MYSPTPPKPLPAPEGAPDRTVFAFQMVVLVFLWAFYVWNLIRHLSTLPSPDDLLNYAGLLVWDSTYGFFTHFEGMALATLISLVAQFVPSLWAGPVVMALINVSILALGMAWCYRQAGFPAGLIFGVLVNSSYAFLGYASFVYPGHAAAFFSLAALAAFSVADRQTPIPWRFIAGALAAGAVLSKFIAIVVPIYLGGILLWRRDWKGFAQWVAGALAAILVLLGAFVLAYDFASLTTGLRQFAVMAKVVASERVTPSMSVTWTLLTSFMFLPVFITLLIAGAYRWIVTRHLLMMAWLSIGVTYLASAVTMQDGDATQYLFTAYVLAALALSMHVGRMVARLDGAGLWPIVLGSGACVLLVLGFHLGISHPPLDPFPHQASHIDPYALFHFHEDIRVAAPIRWLYNLGPIVAVLALLSTEASRRWWSASVLIAVLAVWGASFQGGVAYRKAESIHQTWELLHDASNIFEQLPVDSFSVYMKAWNDGAYLKGMSWIYQLMSSDSSFRRARGGKLPEALSGLTGIEYIFSEQALPKIQNPYIVTDDMEVVRHSFTKVALVEERQFRGNSLYLVEILKRRLPIWIAPISELEGELERAPLSSLSTVVSDLKVCGERGSFSVSAGEDATGRFLRIMPQHGATMMQLCFEPAEMSVSEFRTLIVAAKASVGTEATIFIQDHKNGDWERSSTPIGRYLGGAAVGRKPREGADDVVMGIWWNVNGRPHSVLEVRDVQVF